MKKIFLSRWETILHAILLTGVFTVAFQVTAMGLRVFPLMLGLLVTWTIYLCIEIFLFVRQRKLRRVTHFFHGIFSVIFLAILYEGNMYNILIAGFVFELLIYVIIAFAITRVTVWLYKKWQAKRTPPVQEDEHDG